MKVVYVDDQFVLIFLVLSDFLKNVFEIFVVVHKNVSLNISFLSFRCFLVDTGRLMLFLFPIHFLNVEKFFCLFF